jgi:hypothetical protein
MSPGEGVRDHYRKQGVDEFRAALVKAIELNDYKLYEIYDVLDKEMPYLTIKSIAKFVKEFEI